MDTNSYRESLSFIGRLAMGRQFAMVTVVLLVTAVGLWYVPYSDESPRAAENTVDGPDNSYLAEPSGALTPAEPLELAMDRNRRRVRPRHEVTATSDREKTPASTDGRSPRATGSSEPGKSADRGDRGGLVNETIKSVLALCGVDLQEEARGPTTPGPAAPPDEPVTNATGQATASEPTEALKGPGNGTQRDGTQRDGTQRDGTQRDGTQQAGSTRELYDRGMERYRARDVEGAITDLSQVAKREDAGRLAPSALLYLGRSFRSSGKCSEAVRHYGSLLEGFPAFARRSEALVEAAGCYRRLGDGGRALALLEEAGRMDDAVPAPTQEDDAVGE